LAVKELRSSPGLLALGAPIQSSFGGGLEILCDKTPADPAGTGRKTTQLLDDIKQSSYKAHETLL
jgi:hypothetical protein